MSTPRFLLFAGLAAALLLGGCSSPEMKGTPFYSGEYALNVADADMRRVNLWPLTYYREPALSVLWPVFEHTEEHLAVRPFFSAYGDPKGYREYNVLWPLCQADTKSDDYRIFPYYWGTSRGGKQSYHVLFPFVWHYEDEVHALFPFYVCEHTYAQPKPEERDTWLLWPLLRYRTSPTEAGWHAALFGRYRNPKTGDHHTGYPWPLLFSWEEQQRHGLFTPLYAFEASNKSGVRDGWDAIPLLLSWRSRRGEDQDLTGGLGLYHKSQSGRERSGWLLPFCMYDTRDQLLFTPLFGWDKPDGKDPDGCWYPFTPLLGFRTGAHQGGWLFPLYNHAYDTTNDTFNTSLMLLGYSEHKRKGWREGSSDDRNIGFFPLFSHSVYASTSTDPKTHVALESVHRSDRQLLLHWSGATDTTSRSIGEPARTENDYQMTATDGGLFPLWKNTSRTKTLLNGSPLSRTDERAILLALYDTKRNTVEATNKTPALDYTRRRILWRLWHYEKRNGNVSVDLFPFITRDTRTDGFRKTSFIWRFYRYERAPDGKVARDLFFIPVWRD